MMDERAVQDRERALRHQQEARRARRPCPNCKGFGRDPKDERFHCAECDGSGVIHLNRW